MLVTGENRTEVPSSPSPLEEDTPRPESPTEVPTELPSPSKSPRPADNDEEGGSFFILKGPRIDPEKGYRVDVNEDRDDSPDVESSSVSSASSWNSTDEQMRKNVDEVGDGSGDAHHWQLLWQKNQRQRKLLRRNVGRQTNLAIYGAPACALWGGGWINGSMDLWTNL